ncbi:MAG: rhodanese-like domain-containing protein [Crocinitomicaceae bacterium]|nr:rhodanese-like domain-containing protein [Crocinitomicaceae bacterium]
MEHLDQTTWLAQYNDEENAVILDVRTPGEWAEGIIAGAQKLNIMDTQNFVAEIEQMDKSKSYFIYCRSGNRSGQACQIMEQFGFEKTYNLVGGVMEWTGELV